MQFINFLNEKNFVYVHTPIITGSDCEGAGEMFRVTTLDLENLPKEMKTVLIILKISLEKKQVLL